MKTLAVVVFVVLFFLATLPAESDALGGVPPPIGSLG